MSTFDFDFVQPEVKCQICGALYSGWHFCQGYSNRYYTASMGDVIDELKR